jgi:hypothetical protein
MRRKTEENPLDRLTSFRDETPTQVTREAAWRPLAALQRAEARSWRNVIRDNKLIALIEFSWHFAFHTKGENTKSAATCRQVRVR